MRPRILCVDSDPRISRWLRKSFKAAHFDCDIVAIASGREAFKLLTSEALDLCLTEYALPDITGVQLCGLLRQTGVKIPVIVLSVLNRPVDTERAAEAGADLYLSKSDGGGKIAMAVRDLLRIPPAVLARFTTRHNMARAA